MRLFQSLTLFAVLLALCVVSLGAYTRLTDAGLGCPDWPGCYGQLAAPHTDSDVAKAQAAFPGSPVETPKAQTEMSHRYVAFSLGCLILVVGVSALLFGKRLHIPKALPLMLMIVVVSQALLGMWTVTLKLLPIVVLLHLLGGLCTLSLLWLLWLTQSMPLTERIQSPSLHKWALAATGMLIIQILLGGWTSTNYAALICPDFPTCWGTWWPVFSLKALNFLGGVGLENPLGYMDASEKATIHMLHRLGALFTALLGTYLAWRLIQTRNPRLSKMALWLIGLLFLQITLGILNVMLSLPLLNAVLHHFVACLLLLTFLRVDWILLRNRATCKPQP